MKSHSVFLVLVLLSGCTLAPRYTRPAMPVPQNWAATVPNDTQVAGVFPCLTEWRNIFTDPGMQFVIEEALSGNRDLRAAALNVERAAAMYRIQRSDLSPAVGVLATGNRYRIPEKMSDSGKAVTASEYSVNLGILDWEIDLFGRIRSLTDIALHQYLATDSTRTAAELSLISAVASSYLMLAADRELLALAQSTLTANQSFYDLILKSSDLGVATDLEVNQALSQVESSRADVARIEGNLRIDENRLSLLAGEPIESGSLPEGLKGIQPIRELNPGLSSDVLLNRPDIMAAEHMLIAANANIGVARAAFFPRVSLTAAVGTLSPEISSLFKSGTKTFTVAPEIITPIFAGGALRSNLDASRLSREMAVAEYEGAIQKAFTEVSNALIEYSTLSNERDAVESLVSTLDKSYHLATARYEGGIDSYLQVLVVERSLYAARQRLVGLRLAEQSNRVTLFKVLGGERNAEETNLTPNNESETSGQQ